MKDPILKKRKVAVANLNNGTDIKRIIWSMMNKDGVISLNVDAQKHRIKMEYDLRKIKFEEIENSLKRLGLRLSQNFLARLKRGLAKFTEQNELDNLSAPLSSCCDDPKKGVRDCNGCIS